MNRQAHKNEFDITRIKQICQLSPGDVFLDTLGARLEVEKIKPLRWDGNPYVEQKIRVYFKTQTGRRMFMSYRASREVEIR